MLFDHTAIDQLLGLHDQIYEAERSGALTDHRADYMKYLVEMDLIEHGHSLDGMLNLSNRHKSY